MRIPHIINENVWKAYSSSVESLALIGESQRLVVADDFLWNENHILSLADFCVQSISKNFERYPEILNDLPCENREYLLEILPCDLQIECAIVHVDDEHYWKRRYRDKFGKFTKNLSTWNWKSCYIERHLREILEQAQPQYNDEQYMDEILKLSAPYVKSLTVTQLQVWKPPLTMEKEDIPQIFPINRIDFQYILHKLPLLTEVDIVIGIKGVGENFTWSMFDVSVTFIQNFGRALLDLKHLKKLKIHCTEIEYLHAQALVQNLIKNNTITKLDLSNCSLGDDGALCVAKLLMNHPTLQDLSLANNNIRQKGAEGIGFALLNMNQKVFQQLDLRLNPFGREGTMGIYRALVRCSVPKILSLSGCLFEDDIPERTGQVLNINVTLKSFDICNNWFGEAGGEILVEAMKENKTLESLDLRDTDITPSQLATIKNYLLRNIEDREELEGTQ